MYAFLVNITQNEITTQYAERTMEGAQKIRKLFVGTRGIKVMIERVEAEAVKFSLTPKVFKAA